MTETLVPSVPPVSPFEAYTIIIVLPFLMRLIFVAPPLVDLSNKLMPKEDRSRGRLTGRATAFLPGADLCDFHDGSEFDSELRFRD